MFKIYLKKLEDHLFEFAKNHRAHIFLVKLKSKLKNKILSTSDVSKTREEILAMIIMQKKTLKRTRHASDNHFEHASRDTHTRDQSTNSQSSNRDRFYSNRDRDFDHDDFDNNDNFETQTTQKRRFDAIEFNEKSDICFYCHRKRH